MCEAVSDVWQPEDGREIILNLPATVESATPNVYADQIEWFSRQLTRRESTVITLHPHNDRGTAVAATELAMMAGADRVEGCLFGHGERTGNVCLVTLGMNLFSQGVDPMIDFSDIDEIRRTVEYCTQLPVHPRHPYAGDLVYTAFSGSHQDAIKKGLEDLERQAADRGVPVGELPGRRRTCRSTPRTSAAPTRPSSGSTASPARAAWPTSSRPSTSWTCRAARRSSSAAVVQERTDAEGGEMSADEIWTVFADEYLHREAPLKLNSVHTSSAAGEKDALTVNVYLDGERRTLEGVGNGPIAAFVNAINELPGPDGDGRFDVRVLDYAEHALSSGGDAIAAAYVECLVGDRVLWGVGLDPNIVTASLKAVISAVNRSSGRRPASRSVLDGQDAGGGPSLEAEGVVDPGRPVRGRGQEHRADARAPARGHEPCGDGRAEPAPARGRDHRDAHQLGDVAARGRRAAAHDRAGGVVGSDDDEQPPGDHLGLAARLPRHDLVAAAEGGAHGAEGQREIGVVPGEHAGRPVRRGRPGRGRPGQRRVLGKDQERAQIGLRRTGRDRTARTAGSSVGVTSSTHSRARGTPSSACRARTRRTSSGVRSASAPSRGRA